MGLHSEDYGLRIGGGAKLTFIVEYSYQFVCDRYPWIVGSRYPSH